MRKRASHSKFLYLLIEIEFLADFFSGSDSSVEVGVLPRPHMLPGYDKPIRKATKCKRDLKYSAKVPKISKTIPQVIPKHSTTSPIYNHVPAPTMRPGRAACHCTFELSQDGLKCTLQALAPSLR
jgi:hypothetical protein